MRGSRVKGWEGREKAAPKRGSKTCPLAPGPFPGSRLYLLATVHGDPAGYARAWRFLECLQPEVITVEISRFAVRYREQAGKSWRQRLNQALKMLPPESAGSLAVARVAAQVALPFEYRVARDWGEVHRAAVKLLDAGSVARRHLPRYATELLTVDNLRKLSENQASGTLADFVAAEFHKARRAREGKLRLPPRSADAEGSRRERLWAKRLKRLVDGASRVVHLGGWEHLVPWEGGGGLTKLLADLNPCILLLDEADGDSRAGAVINDR